MAYQTGSVAGPNELLSAMSTFLAANGWTVDDDSVQGNGRKLTVHRGGAYYAMRSSNGTDTVSTIGLQFYSANTVSTGIWLVGGRGIQQDANWYTLLGRPINSSAQRAFSWADFNNQAGPFTYHMFANTDGPYEFLVVAEYVSTKWTWLGFSDSMNMVGDWGQNGSEPHVGAWYGASRDSYYNNVSPEDPSLRGSKGPFCDVLENQVLCQFFRGPVDPTSGDGRILGETFAGYTDGLTGLSTWAYLGDVKHNTTIASGVDTNRAVCSMRLMAPGLLRSCPTIWNAADILVPLMTWRYRPSYFGDVVNNRWNNSTSALNMARSFFGYPTFIRYVDMTNLNPGDTLTIGGDTWRAFPDLYKGYVYEAVPYGDQAAYAQAGFAVRQ